MVRKRGRRRSQDVLSSHANHVLHDRIRLKRNQSKSFIYMLWKQTGGGGASKKHRKKKNQKKRKKKRQYDEIVALEDEAGEESSEENENITRASSSSTLKNTNKGDVLTASSLTPASLETATQQEVVGGDEAQWLIVGQERELQKRRKQEREQKELELLEEEEEARRQKKEQERIAAVAAAREARERREDNMRKNAAAKLEADRIRRANALAVAARKKEEEEQRRRQLQQEEQLRIQQQEEVRVARKRVMKMMMPSDASNVVSWGVTSIPSEPRDPALRAATMARATPTLSFQQLTTKHDTSAHEGKFNVSSAVEWDSRSSTTMATGPLCRPLPSFLYETTDVAPKESGGNDRRRRKSYTADSMRKIMRALPTTSLALGKSARENLHPFHEDARVAEASAAANSPTLDLSTTDIPDANEGKGMSNGNGNKNDIPRSRNFMERDSRPLTVVPSAERGADDGGRFFDDIIISQPLAEDVKTDHHRPSMEASPTGWRRRRERGHDSRGASAGKGHADGTNMWLVVGEGQGIVKSFGTNYGFIWLTHCRPATLDSPSQLYFHASQILSKGSMVSGQNVAFSIEYNRATNNINATQVRRVHPSTASYPPHAKPRRHRQSSARIGNGRQGRHDGVVEVRKSESDNWRRRKNDAEGTPSENSFQTATWRHIRKSFGSGRAGGHGGRRAMIESRTTPVLSTHGGHEWHVVKKKSSFERS
eukprot:g1267.t1